MTLVFIDTETTSLRPDRRAWEIALIVRRDDPARDVERSWFIEAEDLDLGNADLHSLKIGRFHERHPQMRGEAGTSALVEADVLRAVEGLTRGATLVGMVPNFDAEVLGERMRFHGICPSWHYHLVDVEPLVVGWVAGLRAAGGGENGRAADLPSLPWKSDELSLAVGVEPPGDDQRHTALGDARWVRDVYDAVMKG